MRGVKPSSLLDAASAQALAFAWLADAAGPASEYGARVFAGRRPFAPGEEAAAQAHAQHIADVAAALDETRLDAIRDTLRGTPPDAVAAISLASMGDVLADANFLELQRFCDAIDRVDALVGTSPGIEPVANEAVRAIARALEPGRSGASGGFYLADTFGGTLAAARSDLAETQAEFGAARGRAVAAIGRRLRRDDVAGEEFIVMRADLQAPLPAGVRVLREAPTYVLCTIEYDAATLGALERRDAAGDTVAAAEEGVRAALSSVVRERAAGLGAAVTALGELDVLVAGARFTRRHRCRVARIAAEPALAMRAGRFLPLEIELAAEGRNFTPVDVELHDIAVLTGPNMGGKSVCLRTCGFVALCAAFGLPVPADSAEISLFDEIAWLGIGGDEDQLGGLLSSFAKEVVRLREVLERDGTRLFVLLDEFARTTTPLEGKALLVALLERLRERNARGLAATHLAGVATAAGVRHFAVRGLRGIPQRPPTGDLHDALAMLSTSMDYTIAEVEGDSATAADAIALASLLGLDGELIDAAYRHLK
jgi:DNA mismatch repair protein MutS2